MTVAKFLELWLVTFFVKLTGGRLVRKKQIAPLSARFVGKLRRNRKFGARAANGESCESIKKMIIFAI